MLRKIGSSLIHQPSTQYPCTSPQSLHEMNRRFGELKLALGVIGLPVTARDRILRCSPPVVGTTRAGPPFRKMKGPNESQKRGLQIPHLIGGGKRIDTSM